MAAKELFSTTLFNDANLQSYYRMEGNSNDAKGSNNGTDTNITYSSGNGKFNQGAGFNGTTSKIDFGNVLNQATNDFTWVMWVNLPASGNNAAAALVGKRANDAVFAGYEIQYGDASGNLQVVLTDTGGSNLIVLSNCGFAPDGAYHHLAVVVDRANSIVRVYKDGVQIKTGAISNANSITNTGTLKFGVELTSTFFTNQKLDDVAVFNRVLTPIEINNLAVGPASGGFFNFI